MKIRNVVGSVAACMLISILTLANSECNASSDSVQRDQQEQILMAGTVKVGMPSIRNFWEREQLKMILELRDKGVPTITYTENMNGVKIKLCDHSFGYGIPYATQFSNPMKYVNTGTGTTLPQADPNGLFSPASADATWVMCQNIKKDRIDVLYVEPKIVVSPDTLESYVK